MNARCWIVAGISILAAGHVHADDGGIAEQLFRDGKRLLAEGKISDACRAFEGSLRKEAATSTLLNLADCYEKDGRLASAWSSFVEAERLLRDQVEHAALKDVARARAAALEPRLSRLRIDVPTRNVVPGLEVRRGGTVIDQAEWGAAIALDRGQYVVSAQAPGSEPWSTTVVVGTEGDHRVVVVPLLATAQVSVGQPARAPARIGAYVMAGGGVLVAGSLAFGLLAKMKLDDAKALCGDELRCGSEADRRAGQALIDASRVRGNVATGLAVGGLLAVGAGVAIMLLRKPERPERRAVALRVMPMVAVDRLGLTVGGAM